jgi:hypothetical protein
LVDCDRQHDVGDDQHLKAQQNRPADTPSGALVGGPTAATAKPGRGRHEGRQRPHHQGDGLGRLTTGPARLDRLDGDWWCVTRPRRRDRGRLPGTQGRGGSGRSGGRLVRGPTDGLADTCRASPGRVDGLADEDGSCLAATSGGGRRAETCAARPCEIPSWLTSSRSGDGSRHCLVAAAAVSMACSSLASSADIRPISTRSSGLMNPSLSRKPPARAIASRSGTAQ